MGAFHRGRRRAGALLARALRHCQTVVLLPLTNVRTSTAAPRIKDHPDRSRDARTCQQTPLSLSSRLRTMGFSVRLVPGVRVRVSSRGVRTSLGPRAARLHLGAGAPGFSTGIGPVTYSTSLGVARRTSSGSITRSVEAASRAEAAEQLIEVYKRIDNLHRQEFPPATRPLAPPLDEINEVEIWNLHRAAHLQGVSWFARDHRRQALANAEADARQEIDWHRWQLATQQEDAQAVLDREWQSLVDNQPEVVMSALAAAFEDNDAAAAPLSVSGGEATLVVIVPAADAMPQRKPDLTPAGRLTIKTLPKKEAADWHKHAVAGCVLVTAREAFAVAPGLRSVRFVAVAVADSDSYGNHIPHVLVAAKINRAAVDGVQWATTDSIQVLNDTCTDLHVRQVGVTKAFMPLDLSDEPELAELLEAIRYDDLVD